MASLVCEVTDDGDGNVFLLLETKNRKSILNFINEVFWEVRKILSFLCFYDSDFINYRYFVIFSISLVLSITHGVNRKMEGS